MKENNTLDWRCMNEKARHCIECINGAKITTNALFYERKLQIYSA